MYPKKKQCKSLINEYTLGYNGRGNVNIPMELLVHWIGKSFFFSIGQLNTCRKSQSQIEFDSKKTRIIPNYELCGIRKLWNSRIFFFSL